MTQAIRAPLRIAFVGNSLPRRCGIATFTADLQQAVAAASSRAQTSIVAMNDPGRAYEYPPEVALQIAEDRIEDYVRAADALNAGADVVSLQHEFGIFGGEAGGYVVALLERLTVPVVSTLHTVLAKPTPAQRAVMDRILALSVKVVVMAEKGRQLLRDVYCAPAGKIEVIPHGIPDFAFVEPDAAKTALGFAGRPVILTFGLLSPNKGLETIVDAMPAILQSRPDAAYVVLGATHPNLVRREGEAYRDSLVARARELGVEGNVCFVDRFVDRPTLLEHISMCDVYVTPYLNEAQMTSGTLAYSFGLGKAVVSTPYWHARELLADGRGVLVPFGDSVAAGEQIAALLTDDGRRDAMRERAYASSRSMTWERVGLRYLAAFDAASALASVGPLRAPALAPVVRAVAATGPAGRAVARIVPRADVEPPQVRLGHLFSMCDDTGLFQHALHSVADRAHGYCVDDNARALLLSCALDRPGEDPLPEVLTARLAAFVQHAWNPDTRRFRNFMGFDRRWLEPAGSEDSHGRTLWALGVCARADATAPRRRWARELFAQALHTVAAFTSPRSWAFALLGLDAYCAAVADDSRADAMRRDLADRLVALLEAVETPGWVWFEEGLSYDNARLSQALILAGRATGTPSYVEAGLRSLRWLMTQQTSPSGLFRPVGTEGFADVRRPPRPFDQQPVEAAATISACLAARRAEGAVEWRVGANRAFAWFLGANDLSVALVDLETGACRDGLHPDRANENCGGESVVSWLLGLCEMRQLARLGDARSRFEPRAA